jgi:hypothetical protein
MEVRLIDVRGFQPACIAMRLSFGSKSEKSDIATSELGTFVFTDDRALLLKLIKNGDSHAKVTRMIQCWLDITAPRYWWQEFATYCVGVTTMSESTVHTITDHDLTEDDFEGGMDEDILRKLYNMRNLDGFSDKNYMMRAMKHILPESFLQRRIVNLNYQVLRHIYMDRKGHRLPEWKIFLDFIDTLPFPEFIKEER